MSATLRAPARPICKVIVYDDQADQLKRIKETVEASFAHFELTVEVETVARANELKAALERCPDVVICDVSLDDAIEDNLKGLETIQNLKPRHPHISFIAATANLHLLEKLNQFQVFPDYILPKDLLFNIDDAFRLQLVTLLLSLTKQNRSFDIAMSPKVQAHMKEAFGWQRFEKDMMECLVRQVFSTNALPGDAAVDPTAIERGDFQASIIERVEIRDFDGSSTGSPVFLAVPTIRGEVQEIAVVLKFGKVSDYFAEIGNYERFVKWTLPYAWRVDVLGAGQVEKFGIIGYSLAFAGSSNSKPLAHFIASGDVDAVRLFMSRAFDDENKVWYKNPASWSGDGLIQTLTHRLFSKPNRIGGEAPARNKAVDDAVARIMATEVARLWPCEAADKRLAVRRPLLRLFQQDWKPYQVCICHGDLHAGNIMISAATQGMAFIDFRETGIHHVFTDFVFFENALRKDGGFQWEGVAEALLAERADIAAVLRRERLPESGVPLGRSLVRTVRNRALANFEHEPMAHYFIHLLLFTVHMLAGQQDMKPPQIERLATLAIACTLALSDHKEPSQ